MYNRFVFGCENGQIVLCKHVFGFGDLSITSHTLGGQGGRTAEGGWSKGGATGVEEMVYEPNSTDEETGSLLETRDSKRRLFKR